MRRTKATLIYRRTKNLRAVQLLLGHTKLESTVRYLGIEVDDALEIAVQTEVQVYCPVSRLGTKAAYRLEECRKFRIVSHCGPSASGASRPNPVDP